MKAVWNATPPQLKSVRRRRLTAQWSRCISPRFLSVIFVTAFLCTKASAEGADFDGSGRVDLRDFFLFADAFGGSLSRYDLNSDGRVDLLDFFIFADSFGKQVGCTDSSACNFNASATDDDTSCTYPAEHEDCYDVVAFLDANPTIREALEFESTRR